MLGKQDAWCYWTDLNRKITPLFRQLYQETISYLQMELKAALVDLGHKSGPRAFDLLMKEAWNPEQAAMGNSTLPTVLDKLNIMSTIHLRKLIATLVRENGQRDALIGKLEDRLGDLEDKLNEMKQPNTDETVWLLVPSHRNSCNHSFTQSCSSKIRAGSCIAVFNRYWSW